MIEDDSDSEDDEAVFKPAGNAEDDAEDLGQVDNGEFEIDTDAAMSDNLVVSQLSSDIGLDLDNCTVAHSTLSKVQHLQEESMHTDNAH